MPTSLAARGTAFPREPACALDALRVAVAPEIGGFRGGLKLLYFGCGRTRLHLSSRRFPLNSDHRDGSWLYVPDDGERRDRVLKMRLSCSSG